MLVLGKEEEEKMSHGSEDGRWKMERSGAIDCLRRRGEDKTKTRIGD